MCQLVLEIQYMMFGGAFNRGQFPEFDVPESIFFRPHCPVVFHQAFGGVVAQIIRTFTELPQILFLRHATFQELAARIVVPTRRFRCHGTVATRTNDAIGSSIATNLHDHVRKTSTTMQPNTKISNERRRRLRVVVVL